MICLNLTSSVPTSDESGAPKLSASNLDWKANLTPHASPYVTPHLFPTHVPTDDYFLDSTIRTLRALPPRRLRRLGMILCWGPMWRTTTPRSDR